MDLLAFSESLEQAQPPDALPPVLIALWKAAKGNWEEAHNIVQDDPGREAAWVHAYLHRVEGDTFNAGYWYNRAGKRTATGDLKNEWNQIVVELLSELD